MRPIGGFLVMATVALLLRSTILASLATHGVVVDALAFATVVWALRHGDSWGSSFGFFLGLVADLDAARWLGRHALVLSLLGYALGRLSSTLVRESARTQFALLAVTTLVHQAWSASFELGGGIVAAPWLLAHTLLATGVTASLGTLLLMATRRLVGRPLFGYASRTTRRIVGRPLFGYASRTPAQD
jgi:rod shape-determining protein MreD